MGARRSGREAAVQFMYQADALWPKDIDVALTDFWQLVEATQATRTFAEDLIRGTVENSKEIDTKIRELADNWDFKRLAAVDRSILRVAVYEMMYRNEIPPVVSINEAIEIAKQFSTEESGRFVNGILDRLKKDLLRPARQAAGDAKIKG